MLEIRRDPRSATVRVSGRNVSGRWVFGASRVGQVGGFGLSRKGTQDWSWTAGAGASRYDPLGEPNPLPIAKGVICNDKERLKRCMHNFLLVNGIGQASNGEVSEEHYTTVEEDEQDKEERIHLLDYLRRAVLRREREETYREIKMREKCLHLRKYSIGTVRELKAAGIRITKSLNSFYPTFIDGELKLPCIAVDGSTALICLNLVAYEMCLGFRNDFEITSLVVVLCSLIDRPEDVKEMRRMGVLRNKLGSDKEVADIFNKMDVLLVPETPAFAQIRDEIEAHFKSKRGRIRVLRWMGEAFHTYFRSPWTVTALLAEMLGLSLTFIQTFYSVRCKS